MATPNFHETGLATYEIAPDSEVDDDEPFLEPEVPLVEFDEALAAYKTAFCGTKFDKVVVIVKYICVCNW